jgi:hypothetical protein
MREEQQHRIYLDILSEALACGQASLAGENIETDTTIIGFRCEHNGMDAIAVYLDASLKLVNEWRRSQGEQQLKKRVVTTGLERTGVLLEKGKGGATIVKHNPAAMKKERALVIDSRALDNADSQIGNGGNSFEIDENQNCYLNSSLPDEENQGKVTEVTEVTVKTNHHACLQHTPPQTGMYATNKIGIEKPVTSVTSETRGVLPHSNGDGEVTVLQNAKNETVTSATSLPDTVEPRHWGRPTIDDERLGLLVRLSALDNTITPLCVGDKTNDDLREMLTELENRQRVAGCGEPGAHWRADPHVPQQLALLNIRPSSRFLWKEQQHKPSRQRQPGRVGAQQQLALDDASWLDEIAGITLPDGLPSCDEILASLGTVEGIEDGIDDWQFMQACRAMEPTRLPVRSGYCVSL